MAATITGVSQNTGAAAATATCLITFAQSLGDILEAFIRGSANASATISAIYDNAGLNNGQVDNGATTTAVPILGASFTTNQWAGATLTFSIAGTGIPQYTQRVIVSNTSTTLTVSPALPAAPGSGLSGVMIGNTWSALGTWTADGGAATSHAQWLHATNVLAAAGSAVTLTVVWAGGSTGFTMGVLGITGAATGSTPEVVGTAASGTGTAPIAGSVTGSGSGLLLGGFSTVTTAQTYSSPLDNAAGAALTQQVPASGTYRVFVGTRAESAGTYAPRVTQTTSEGWVAIALFVPDAGGGGISSSGQGHAGAEGQNVSSRSIASFVVGGAGAEGQNVARRQIAASAAGHTGASGQNTIAPHGLTAAGHTGASGQNAATVAHTSTATGRVGLRGQNQAALGGGGPTTGTGSIITQGLWSVLITQGYGTGVAAAPATPGRHTVSDRALFVHTVSDRALVVHTVDDLEPVG